MSDELLQLQQLSDLAKLEPLNTSGAAASVWDDLVKILRDLFNNILKSVIDPLKSQVSTIYNYLKDKFTDTINQIKGAVSAAVTSLTTALNDAKNTIVSAVQGVVDDVINGVSGLIGDIGDAIREAIGWLVDKIGEVVEAVRNIGQTIGNAIANAIRDIGDWIRDALRTALEGIGDFLAGVVDAVGEWLGNLIDNLKETVKGVVDAAKEWIGNVYTSIKDYIANLIDTLKAAYESARQTIEDKIQAVLDFFKNVADMAATLINQAMTIITTWWNNTVVKIKDTLPEYTKDFLKPLDEIYKALMSGNYQKAFDLLDAGFKSIGLPAPIEVLHAFLSAIAYFWEVIHLQFVPLEVAAAKKANIALGLDPVSLDAAAVALIRGKASKGEFYANAALAGASADRADMVYEAAKALPTAGAIQEGFLRGEISEKEHDKLLESYGFTDKHIELFKALYFLIPPPTDLIRMAVREAFTPEIAEKFGQYEDFPTAFLEWAEKQGISEDWAKRYWAAHWDLPSPSMGFEMLHRRIIDADEVKLLLRALDVMPYWRERLIQLSYNPVTRVDLRRMYKMGVITEDDVYNGYLDLGYNDTNAQRLTEFTKRYSAPEDESELDQFRSMARSVYSQAYKKKIISLEEYKAFLSNLGYAADDITLLIQLDDFAIQQAEKLFDLADYRKDLQKLTLTAYDRGLVNREDLEGILGDLGYEYEEIQLELSISEYNRQLKLRDMLVDQLHSQYVDYMIDLTQLHTILDMFGFRSAEIDKLQEEWDIERNYRTKRPPLSDLRRFLEAGLINLDQYLDELRGQGYHEKYISLYRQTLTT